MISLESVIESKKIAREILTVVKYSLEIHSTSCSNSRAAVAVQFVFINN